jgi:dihydrofolate reductase
MLRQEDVIDLYRFMVQPILLGKGRRLFADGADEKNLRPTHTQVLSSGIVTLEYEPALQP